MIKIENVVIPSDRQWEAVVRGVRNPFNSWDKSDSDHAWDFENNYVFRLGKNDLTLMNRLANAGDDHGKFMRMLPVIVDITAPHYWWPEMDQYRIGTCTDSCSKMHTLLQKPFEKSDFTQDSLFTMISLTDTIASLNYLRKRYLEEEDTGVKEQIWQSILEQLPLGYLQKRTWSANYQTLKHIYHARKNHKLHEWRDFCEWIETLPYAKELIIGEME